MPAAVIDWELATLGDPLLDLALMLTYQRRAKLVSERDSTEPAKYDATLAPGYLTEQQIIEHYEAESGRELEGFGFHLGLACFKLAAISEASGIDTSIVKPWVRVSRTAAALCRCCSNSGSTH